MIENFIYIWLGISIRKSGGWEMEGVTCTRRWLIWSLSLSQSMLLSSLELSSLPFMFSLHILCQVLQFLVPLSLLENVPSKLIASTPLLVILYVFWDIYSCSTDLYYPSGWHSLTHIWLSGFGCVWKWNVSFENLVIFKQFSLGIYVNEVGGVVYRLGAWRPD